MSEELNGSDEWMFVRLWCQEIFSSNTGKPTSLSRWFVKYSYVYRSSTIMQPIFAKRKGRRIGRDAEESPGVEPEDEGTFDSTSQALAFSPLT